MKDEILANLGHAAHGVGVPHGLTGYCWICFHPNNFGDLRSISWRGWKPSSLAEGVRVALPSDRRGSDRGKEMTARSHIHKVGDLRSMSQWGREYGRDVL